MHNFGSSLPFFKFFLGIYINIFFPTIKIIVHWKNSGYRNKKPRKPKSFILKPSELTLEFCFAKKKWGPVVYVQFYNLPFLLKKKSIICIYLNMER